MPDLPAAAVHLVDTVEQLRALSDPLRLRLLEAFCGPPRTTKQVADRLGEKPTRLYHHVEALETAGLVRLVRTRPKRGTLEKYYQAAARQFRVDSRLFPGAAATPGDAETPAWIELAAGVLETAAREARGPRIATSADGEAAVMVADLEVRGGPGTRQRVRERLEALVAELEAMDAAGDETTEAVRLTVALLPLADGDA